MFVGLLSVTALFAAPATACASEGTLLTLVNDNSNLCVSLPGDVVVPGARIDQWDCGIYPDQYWYWNPSNSHPGWYYLQPEQNDKLCATYVPGTNDNLALQPCGVNATDGNANTQLWFYDGVSRELKTMQNLAMSVPAASKDRNVNIFVWPYGPYPDQSWDILLPV